MTVLQLPEFLKQKHQKAQEISNIMKAEMVESLIKREQTSTSSSPVSFPARILPASSGAHKLPEPQKYVLSITTT